jgi:hypothetical protein
MAAMEVKEFQEKIKSYAEQYRDWKKPIDEFRKSYVKKHNIRLFDRNGTKKLDSALQEFTIKHQAQKADPTEVIFTFLGQEYEAYLNATQEECEAIRASFSINREFEDLLLDFVQKATINLRHTKDVKWLERGLVAASLENSGIDSRDTLLSLDDLYRAAEDVGIEANPYFQKAASLASGEKPRGGSTPLNILLNRYAKKPESLPKIAPEQVNLPKVEPKEVKNDLRSILKRLFEPRGK